MRVGSCGVKAGSGGACTLFQGTTCWAEASAVRNIQQHANAADKQIPRCARDDNFPEEVHLDFANTDSRRRLSSRVGFSPRGICCSREGEESEMRAIIARLLSPPARPAPATESWS